MQHNGNENIAPAPQNTSYFSNENTAHMLGRLEAQETASQQAISDLRNITTKHAEDLTTLKATSQQNFNDLNKHTEQISALSQWKAECDGASKIIRVVVPIVCSIIGGVIGKMLSS